MMLHYIFYAIIVFFVKNDFATVGANNSDLLDRQFDEYQRLLKLLRCQEILSNNLRRNQWLSGVDCELIQNTDLEALNGDQNFEGLLNIINALGMETQDDFRTNLEKIKRLLTVVELQRKDIDLLYTLLDALKENRAVVLVNCDKNNHTLNLNSTLTNLRNNIVYLRNNQKLIENRFSNKGKSEIFNINELNELSNELDIVRQKLNKLNCSASEYRLGDFFNAEKLIKKGVNDLFKKENKIKLDNIVDVVKQNIVDGGKGLVENSIDDLIEKGQEVHKKISDIKNVIENTDIKDVVDKQIVDQLDNLKIKLTSHEAVLNGIKNIFFSELKETLLKELYKLYVDYKKKRATARGEPIPQFSDKYDINEMKKGILEFGVRIIFKKIGALFRYIKNKVFRRKRDIENARREKIENEMKERAFQKNIDVQDLPSDFNKDVQISDADQPSNTNANADASAVLELNSSRGDDDFILNNINSILNELDFYESQFEDIESNNTNNTNEENNENNETNANEENNENNTNETVEAVENVEKNEVNEGVEEVEDIEKNETNEEFVESANATEESDLRGLRFRKGKRN